MCLAWIMQAVSAYFPCNSSVLAQMQSSCLIHCVYQQESVLC